MTDRAPEHSPARRGASPLRVLILEDEPAHAELMVRELRRGGFAPNWQRVETEQDYLAHLHSTLDLILADYNLPQFGATRALQLMQSLGLDIPFIVISGTMEEDVAVSLLQHGATDYLLKDRLARLGEAAHRALEQTRLRREKQLADAKLHESAERYRTLFEHVPVGLSHVSPSGEILDANPALLDILGYADRETLMAVNASDLYVDPEVRKHALNVLQRQGIVDYDAQMRRRDGTIIWVRMTLRAVRSPSGEIMHVEGAARDITFRKRAEEGLLRLAAIVNSSDDAIIGAALDGTVTSWNSGAERMFGYTAEEAIGKSVAMLYPKDQLPELSRGLGRLKRGEHLTHVETVRVRKDGTPINVSITLSPIKDAGKVIGISSIARDTTERRHAEEELRKSEERYRLLAQASNDAVWDSDLLAGRIWRGEGMHTLFGYPEDAAQAGIEWWTEKIHPEDRERVTSSIRAVIEGAGSSWSDEYRFRRADGSYAHVSDRGYLVRDAEGHPLRMVGALVDITERKRAEEAVWKANEAARANREKSEFLSRMSHELRTPLNAILGFAQLMEMDVLGPEHQESLKHILKGGQHLLELVNEVLDIARIEAGRMAIALEPVSVNEVVGEALDMIAPLAANVNVRVHAEGPGAPERHIRADRQRITQVLLNLLSNAVKYNHPGGSVILAYESTPEGQLRIKVSDTGPGIPAERMDRLFMPFERLGAEETGVEGTGLGLALSKRLVEAMGGKLGVESTVGKGSTFWVEIAQAEPIQRRESKTQDVSHPAESGAPSNARTVLYIEDNLPNFELVRHLLRHGSKFRLLPAMQGRLGLDLAREHHPHLILLDLHLPDISGDEVLRRLRADPETSQIPVIMISADAMPAQIERLLAAGASAYLTKPIDIKKFLTLVNEILEDGPSPRA